MNAKSKIIAVLMLSLIGPAALAKAPLQVDFNKMIDEGTIDRAELTKAAPANDEIEVSASNRRKVIDFIDMEVSVGADGNTNANVVDRN